MSKKTYNFASKNFVWEDIINYPNDRWLFRGQREEDWGFTTSLERLCDSFDLDLKDAPIIERSIVSEFKRRYHQYSNYMPEDKDNLEWLSIMRHYGAPTRLLDWTYSMHVALYNALEKKCKKDENAVVWVIYQDWMGKEGIVILRDKGCSENEIDQVNNRPTFKKPGNFKNIFLIRDKPITFAGIVCPKRLTQRMTIQKGLFICPGNVSKTFNENITNLKEYDNGDHLIRLNISKDKREEYLDRLDSVNISRTSLYPGLEGFASSLSVFHYTYLKKNLKKSVYRGERGFDVWE